MHFSHTPDSGGSKFIKIGIVAALHVAVGAALINSMNNSSISMPMIAEEIQVFLPKIEPPPPPPPPPEPPKPVPKVAPTPKPFVPKVEVEVQQPPPTEQVMETSSVPDPAPPVPGPTTTEVAAPADAGTGALRTAVLNDGCTVPDYPARAARNGEEGTVTLALLVGANGQVSDSRVQQSSGSRDLDKAAISALSMCTFKPAMAGGAAEAGWAQIAYVWKLD